MSLKSQFDALKTMHQLSPYPEVNRRIAVLNLLKKSLQTHAEDLVKAVFQDFSHRARMETLFLELFPAIKAINYCIKHSKSWMRKRRRKVSWLFAPAHAHQMPQPLGVVGIMVPWNYPLYLAIVPMAYALAAGNRVMVKMSELSPQTGRLLDGLIKEAGLSDYIDIVNGEVEVAKEFASLPFGHLLFTGSTAVGKQVMRAASDNLTPVTLELGGKSPAVISKTVNEAYFDRLLMGKLFNAGQTCIAPDYLMIPKGWESKLANFAKQFIQNRYPQLMSNQDYSAIISEDHKNRLLDLLEDAKRKGADVQMLGDLKPQSRKIPLALVFNVDPSMRIMQEELFGPILPVMTYGHFKEAIQWINRLPNPLALYYFGADKDEIEALKKQTLSGSLSINETIIHIAVDDLPFGGVGASGMGVYHGREGFDIFSQLKPVFVQSRFSPFSWFYPPYGKLMRLLLTRLGGLQLKE